VRKEKKSVKALRARIAKLQARGIDPSLHQPPSVAEVIDLIGDLSLAEVHDLVYIAETDHNNAIHAMYDEMCASEQRAKDKRLQSLRVVSDRSVNED
jgi:hypothetical protein